MMSLRPSHPGPLRWHIRTLQKLSSSTAQEQGPIFSESRMTIVRRQSTAYSTSKRLNLLPIKFYCYTILTSCWSRHHRNHHRRRRWRSGRETVRKTCHLSGPQCALGRLRRQQRTMDGHNNCRKAVKARKPVPGTLQGCWVLLLSRRSRPSPVIKWFN